MPGKGTPCNDEFPSDIAKVNAEVILAIAPVEVTGLGVGSAGFGSSGGGMVGLGLAGSGLVGSEVGLVPVWDGNALLAWPNKTFNLPRSASPAS